MRLPLFLACAALAILIAPARAAETLSPEQLEKVMQEIDKLDSVITGKRIELRASAVEAFRRASADEKSTWAFYLACVKMVRFDSRDARASEFREWQDRNEAQLREESNLIAMRLQLQYLVLCLRAAEGQDMALLVPEVEKFVANIAANADQLAGAMRILRDPVSATIFAEAYELNQTLRSDKWAYAPGRFNEVYDKIVFPYFRERQIDGLPAAWDRRIALEVQLAEQTAAENPAAYGTFQDEQLPRLKWARAVDLYKSGFQQQGALAMIQIMQASPDHPNASDWLNECRNLIEGPAGA